MSAMELQCPTRSPNPFPSFQRGFSLIELIAAFVIFALGFGILLQVLGGSIRNTQWSADYTQAALWAQSKLDVVGVGEPVKEGSTSGEFDRDYHWDLQISKYQPNDGGAQTALTTPAVVDLYKIDLQVSWGGGQRAHSARFVTLRASNPNINGTNLNSGFSRASSPNRSRGGNKQP